MNSFSTLLCQEGQEKLPENKIVVAGGFKDEERAVSVSRGTSMDIPGLQSNHEEANTRLLLQSTQQIMHQE